MSVTMPNPVSAPAALLSLLDRLHVESLDQESQFDITKTSLDSLQNSMRDKFVALDQDKAQFVYQIARAINAKNVVEVGTSFGVSTIYLGLAVAQNIETTGGSGTVIGTELEAEKAAVARRHWDEAGEMVKRHIDLRVGDLRETLKSDLPTVDLVLIDIWAPMSLPALKLVQPHLRPGAVIIVDNTIGSASRYKELLEYMRAAGSSFQNMTIPFHKGLEFTTYYPPHTS